MGEDPPVVTTEELRRDPVFDPFPGTDATMFIQWKGTAVCIDFDCPCGARGHYGGYFAYYLRCSCGAVYEMGTQVKAIKMENPADYEDDPSVQDVF